MADGDFGGEGEAAGDFSSEEIHFQSRTINKKLASKVQALSINASQNINDVT